MIIQRKLTKKERANVFPKNREELKRVLVETAGDAWAELAAMMIEDLAVSLVHNDKASILLEDPRADIELADLPLEKLVNEYLHVADEESALALAAEFESHAKRLREFAK